MSTLMSPWGIRIELFTVMIWLSLFGCDVQQETLNFWCTLEVTSVMVNNTMFEQRTII